MNVFPPRNNNNKHNKNTNNGDPDAMSSAFVVGNGNNNSNGVSSSSGSSPRDAASANELLKLALKKPKAWKWELTTSSSSPSICFPKIQLFDSRTGQLMVEVDRPDCVVKSEELMNGVGNESSERSRSSQERKGRDQRYRRSQSMGIREKITTSGEYLSDVFEQLQNKGLGHKLATSVLQYRAEEAESQDPTPLQKSKSVSEIRRSTSSSEQLSAKKKVLKSASSRSSSILGRISELYRSSTEEEPTPVVPPTTVPPPPTIPEINVPEEPPVPADDGTPPESKAKIYKLVRSNAGTLMVREESFHTQRSLRRRRQQQLEAAEQQAIMQDTIPESCYDRKINEIDALISKVMLSHTLPNDGEVKDLRTEPNRRRSMQNGGADHHHHHQQPKKRRSRRSASAGSTASGYGSGRTADGRTIDQNQQKRYSSSSEEDSLLQAAESRFGSLKRRGRAKQRKNAAAAGEDMTQEMNDRFGAYFGLEVCAGQIIGGGGAGIISYASPA
ncbi:uncharacterized protein LOC128732322 [Sabethes cyaneus]|uniref:uncharacterized protein LOC128732322 n=1 Tax=Sabethes cyaneus TaxID=53552 RepID=UPI00237DC9AF|nr:uncharacterized protein LOC128732322 [Sabethes cyaneus]